MNKLILIGLILSLLISSVYAANPYQWSNMMGPAANSAFSSFTLGIGSIKYDDFKEGIFYPIRQWEFDICVAGVTTDLEGLETSGQYGDSTDIKDLYGPITATINAQKYTYRNENKTLYEISWYVQPKPNTQEVKFSISLRTASGTKYTPDELKSITADPAQGAAGYYSKILEMPEYSEAILESNNNVLLRTAIVINPSGSDYG